MNLTIIGLEVSRGYLQLTCKIAEKWGLKQNILGNTIELSSWEIITPKTVKIPSEMSLYPMAILLDNLHQSLQVEIEEQDIDELLFNTLEL